MLRVACVAALVAGIANLVLTAPEPPGLADSWRWSTVAAGTVLSAWNLASAYREYREDGPVSVTGFFHLWLLLAFSFPTVEMTYRYERLVTGFWQTPTENALLFQAAVLIAAFQVLFFLALGRSQGRTLTQAVLGGRATRPDHRLGVLFLVLLLPLLLARLQVLRGLGLSGAAETMVTRTDYFERLTSGVGPLVWALNALFPIYAVTLSCLAVKYLVPHPSRSGRWLYLAVLVGSAAGVALSGGRSELVFVLFTVGSFMYVQGYRSLRQLAPLLVPVILLGGLLFLVAQARHGVDNSLSRLATSGEVGYDYAGGDITQILGLGRFDAVVMILDKHEASDLLLGASYGHALAGALNTTFLPDIALGAPFPTFRISTDVMGYWIFGGRLSSALPSAPGELYLNFGIGGILAGALVLGVMARLLLRWLGRLRGPVELVWLVVVWTFARLLSDESYLIASFVARNWPAMIALSVVLVDLSRRSIGTDAPPTQLARGDA